MKEIFIKMDGENYCEHCGEFFYIDDDIVVRDNKLYHEECLPENLK